MESFPSNKSVEDGQGYSTSRHEHDFYSHESKPETQVVDNSKSTWRDLFAFTERRHLGPLIMAIIAAAFAAAAKTSYAIFLGRVMDILTPLGAGTISKESAMTGVTFWCIILTAMGAAVWIFNSAFMAAWVIFGELIARQARDKIFSNLLNKEMAWFDSQEEGVSSALSAMHVQTRELQIAASQVLGFLVTDFFVAIGCMTIAFYYSWDLTLVLLATIPVSVVALGLISRGLETAIQAQKRELAQGSKLVTAMVTAIDLVKVYNGFDNEVWQYMQTSRKASRYFLQQARRHSMQMGYVKMWMVNLFVVGFWFAVWQVSKGSTTAGDAMTTFYAALTAFQAIEGFGPQWLVLAKGITAGHSLRQVVLDMAASRVQKSGVTAKASGSNHPATCTGDVELNNVSFAYPSNPDKVVLHPASFFFAAGEMTFLVGRSGSGKSTLSNLILKFYEPRTGSILIDGHPVATLADAWVRSNITLIQQSSILFNDSVFMNVAFGGLDPSRVTREEVQAACDMAMLQSTLAGLPEGLDTNVGMGGHNLSGGQKQRLALARARLRDPPVLILDEVTSGLDPISKVLILEAIRIWRAGKTTIVITHDVTQIQDEDYVYVMDQSYLVQEGFRKHLEKDDEGMFASLVALTQGEETGESTATVLSRLAYRPHIVSRSRSGQLTSSSEGGERKGLADSSVVEFMTEKKAAKPEGPHKNVSLFNILSTVWPLLSRSDRLRTIVGLLACLVAAACNPAFSYVFSQLVAVFWAPTWQMSARGQVWAIRLTIIAAVDGVSLFTAHYLMQCVAQSWVTSLRVEALKKILSQPKAFFNKAKHSPSQVVEVLDRNAEEMRNLVGRFVPILLIVAAMMFTAVVWALVTSWKLTLVALASAPAVYAATRSNAAVSTKWEAKTNVASDAAGSVAMETFLNIRVVRALTLEGYFSRRHASSTEYALQTGIKRGVLTGVFYGVNQSMSWWMTALVLWYAATLLTAPSATISVTDIMQVINLLLYSMGSATAMMNNIPQLSQAKATAIQVLYYASLHYSNSHEERGEKRVPTPFPIVMRDLQFAYPAAAKGSPAGGGGEEGDGRKVLRNVNLRIDQGESVAIVGASGCGKSTIANLLLRLYDPLCSSGPHAPLSFAHTAAGDLSTPALRSQIASVPQHPFLFPTTLHENIVYGLHPDSPYRDAAAVVAAAKLACIHGFIVSLPDGYSTIVGEGGVGLSGGQAQRVSIARALVRSPKLLVLDEPTSALDADGAEGVRLAIRSLLEDSHNRVAAAAAAATTAGQDKMAVVVVTHSREMMKMAERIVVMDQGFVAEQGGYDELMSRRGKFAELVGGGVWMPSSNNSAPTTTTQSLGMERQEARHVANRSASVSADADRTESVCLYGSTRRTTEIEGSA
ncbi:hypothetical protein M406DRAFT_96416 [Cryphonectria parasitica EP155]|uniref:Uncharacterized protein n=1 Tax=Cryphonectria parasitica (strain ATCC 38755 / EP155) TaxID=660469 RepID=A0A9P4XW95_CRYP1|nr:uncharacterized protein M406DRAFT_96416 [Cryphonectria parasitica EP155]KAF3762068.1 hypothetical protein M406DRAFT_96416 [Cryphonectria parasitica EP155]